MPTVYFDANFYVWLAKAGDVEADAVVGRLNGLGVRIVLTHVLITELLSYAGPDERNRRLYDRVLSIDAGYINLARGLDWEALLLSQDERRAMAEVFHEPNLLSVQADAQSAFAARPGDSLRDMNPAEREAFIASMGQDTYDELARVETLPDEERFAAGRAALAPMMRQLHGIFDELAPLMEQLAASGTPMPDEVNAALRVLSEMGGRLPDSPEASLDVADRIFAALGPLHDASEARSNMRHAATRTDNRVLDVVAGSASAKTATKLGHTFRDVEHMGVFLSHCDAVDFLQVDGPRYREILRAGDAHELAAAGLVGRLFTAADLGDAVEAVVRLVREAPTDPEC